MNIMRSLGAGLILLLSSTAKAAAPEAPSASPAEKPAVQSELPKGDKIEPKAEAKPEVKAEPKLEAKAETKPEPKAEAKAEPALEAKVEAKPEAKAEALAKPAAPAKELNPIAKAFVPLAEKYKKAHDEMRSWILHIDAETAAVSANISRIQGMIEKNEASITKLKLEGSRESAAQIPELAKDNKQLWSELAAARKERTALAHGYTREAITRAKGYQVDVIETLDAIKSQPK